MICFQDLTWLFSHNSLEHYNRWQSNNLMVQLVMHLDKEKLMLFMCKTEHGYLLMRAQTYIASRWQITEFLGA